MKPTTTYPLLLALMLMIALLVAGCDRVSTQGAAPPAAAPVATTPAPTMAPALTVGAALPDFTQLVAANGPAVVNVSTVGRVATGDDGADLDPSDPLYDFFRRFGFGNGPRGSQPPARGEGSGFIVSADGYLLTNAHVIDGASEVVVRLTDRREYSAKVVGIDPRTDVAVLKIDAENLPTVRIGSPGALNVGEWVIAIGSPFGFDNSVTAGIVSAKARSLPGDAYTPFIQTDVAVNPGNSGGPLFNLRGEVVGINSQIYSRTGGYQGVSFAIPIDVAVDVKNQLVAEGRVSRGKIGVTIQEVNQSLADSFGLPRPRGALVSSVEPRGPADRAGVEAGDVILAVDGRPVERSGELPSLIAGVRPGGSAVLTVWRDRKERQLTVKVGELEEPRVARAVPTATEDGGRLGLAVRPLSATERNAVGTAGAVIVEQATGPAAAAGVERGDILLRINGRAVTSVADVATAAQEAGKTLALLIQRGNAQLYVPVRTG